MSLEAICIWTPPRGPACLSPFPPFDLFDLEGFDPGWRDDFNNRAFFSGQSKRALVVNLPISFHEHIGFKLANDLPNTFF